MAMKISELYKGKHQTLAFEIFPPKPEVPLETLFESIEGFKKLSPDYISVTYGAGGSQRGRTVEIASRIKNQYGIEAMSHLTCVGHTMEEIDGMLAAMKRENISNILALRGDPPVDQPGPRRSQDPGRDRRWESSDRGGQGCCHRRQEETGRSGRKHRTRLIRLKRQKKTAPRSRLFC
jgi:methylenetetrahydrofolate reductase (NADPH)